MEAQFGPDTPVEGLTYFYDFIQVLEEKYAFASVEAIIEEVRYAQLVGPALAGLLRRDDRTFLLKTPIGRGHFAVIELEHDHAGVLQPVMGGFLRD